MITRRHPSDTENKLLLLYAVDKLGPLTAHQLLVFMVENDAMDYVSIQLGLAELVDSSLLRKAKHALGMLYILTGKGRDALSLFEAKVPHSRRTLIDSQVAAWRQRFKRERQMLSSFEKAGESEYIVRLLLNEQETQLLEMKISVPTHQIAQRFCDAWIQEAPGIYAHIMRSLGEADYESAARPVGS